MRSSFTDLKSNKRNSCNSEIAAAEARRLRLLAEKENIVNCAWHQSTCTATVYLA
ncbi:hypothetical protein L195_g028675 [Trifolium pratense]|uniref:Uncharacterized protein n=1 Tax=Trifolium pratense TaxID=57577 RepID=A0A2K3L2N0_TRIPR|nr:hypothetical protein L195_g028675 [Trifolium pratense]